MPEDRSISDVASLPEPGSLALTVNLPSCPYRKVTSTGDPAGRPAGKSRTMHFPIFVASLPLASPPSTTLTATVVGSACAVDESSRMGGRQGRVSRNHHPVARTARRLLYPPTRPGCGSSRCELVTSGAVPASEPKSKSSIDRRSVGNRFICRQRTVGLLAGDLLQHPSAPSASESIRQPAAGG